MNASDWLNKFYNFYTTAVVGIHSTCRYGLSIDTHHGNQSNKSKLALHKPSIHFSSCLKWLNVSNKTEHFSYKGECGVHGRCMRIKTFKRRADLGYR